MIQEVELKVFGMSCSNCAAGIENKLQNQLGIIDIQVDFGSKLAKLKFDKNLTNDSQLLHSIEDLGYEVFPIDEENNHQQSSYSKRLLPGVIIFLPLFILGMFVKGSTWSLNLQAILASIAFPYLGSPYFKSAWKGIKSGILGMDVLVTIGAGSAFLYSWAGYFQIAPAIYFDGSIAILFFLTIGKILEEKAKTNAFASLEELLLMDRKQVRQIIDGDIQLIDLKKVDIGMQILVPAGEIIPIDGLVFKGSSSVDESLLTGEAEPVFKDSQSQVFSGSKNLEQPLHINVTQTANKSTISKIANEVKSAKIQKANLARIADKVSAVFVPIVLFLALVTSVYWYNHAGAAIAILNAVSVLLIACPCALGLATPAAISVGLNTALKHGILIKNIKVIENITKVSHLVLDKTGTLTSGNPNLKSIELFNSHKEEEVLSLAYSMEQNIVHPFATAIINLCQQNNIKNIEDMEVEGLIGKGLKAKFNDNIYLLGSPKFMKDNDITSNFDESFMGFSLAKNKKTIANFYFEDPLRSGAHDFGNFLKSSHLKTILLSGDRKEKVEDMRKLFNLDEAIGEVSPSKKSQVIQSLCKNDNFVAMIGDGMNDSSALAYADLGISFQAASDLAKSSSDIILMQNNLNLIQDAFKISYAIKHKILQNYFWAFLYNLIAIPLAMSGQLNPMVAAAAMALSSTSVVLNSLLLKRALK